MEQQGIDLLFLTPSARMQYLTGIQRERPNFGIVQYPGGWVYSALIGREKGPVSVAPRMVAEFDLLAGLWRRQPIGPSGATTGGPARAWAAG